MTRVADALEGIAAAIRSEMDGGQARRMVRHLTGAKFDTTQANRVAGQREVHELPTVEELATLTDQWRSACTELETRQKEQEDL